MSAENVTFYQAGRHSRITINNTRYYTFYEHIHCLRALDKTNKNLFKILVLVIIVSVVINLFVSIMSDERKGIWTMSIEN